MHHGALTDQITNINSVVCFKTLKITVILIVSRYRVWSDTVSHTGLRYRKRSNTVPTLSTTCYTSPILANGTALFLGI